MRYRMIPFWNNAIFFEFERSQDGTAASMNCAYFEIEEICFVNFKEPCKLKK